MTPVKKNGYIQMKSLLEHINNIESCLLLETFKSGKLRELQKDLKDISDINGEDFLKRWLPRGIAWDQLPDSDIIRGDNSDKDFVKKYSGTDYIIMWYPLIVDRVYNDNIKSRRVSSMNVNSTVYFITSGKSFLCLNPFSDSPAVTRRDTLSYDGDNEYTFEGPRGVIMNAENIAMRLIKSSSKTVISIEQIYSGYIPMTGIAISRDTLLKYSIYSKIQARAESKFGTELRTAQYNDRYKEKNLNRYKTFINNSKASKKFRDVVKSACETIKSADDRIKKAESMNKKANDITAKFLANADLAEYIGFFQVAGENGPSMDIVNISYQIKSNIGSLISMVNDYIVKIDNQESSGTAGSWNYGYYADNINKLNQDTLKLIEKFDSIAK